jgi:hypothetical protein
LPEGVTSVTSLAGGFPIAPVPLPASMWLFIGGLTGLALWSWFPRPLFGRACS